MTGFGETVLVRCPYCAERIELWVDGDTEDTWVEDCEVCCRPWQITVVQRTADSVRLDVQPAQ